METRITQGLGMRRRRICESGHRFTTREVPVKELNELLRLKALAEPNDVVLELTPIKRDEQWESVALTYKPVGVHSFLSGSRRLEGKQSALALRSVADLAQDANGLLAPEGPGAIEGLEGDLADRIVPEVRANR